MVCGQSCLQMVKPRFILSCVLPHIPPLVARTLGWPGPCFPPQEGPPSLSSARHRAEHSVCLVLGSYVLLQPAGHVQGLAIRVQSELLSDTTTSHGWVLLRNEGRNLFARCLITAERGMATVPHNKQCVGRVPSQLSGSQVSQGLGGT